MGNYQEVKLWGLDKNDKEFSIEKDGVEEDEGN